MSAESSREENFALMIKGLSCAVEHKFPYSNKGILTSEGIYVSSVQQACAYPNCPVTGACVDSDGQLALQPEGAFCQYAKDQEQLFLETER